MTTDNMTTGSKPMQRWIIPALWYGGFWLLLTLWLRYALPESIMGWERHQLFRFSTEYLTFFSRQPYPALLYIQAFFTQFYIFPWLGAAVIGGLLTLGMAAWQQLTGRLWPGALWTAFMLPTIPYFNLLWILIWLVLLGGGCLINRQRQSPTGRMGLTTGLALIATFILHENIVLAIVFWAVVYGATRSWRVTGLGLAAGLIGAALGIGLLIWIGYPFIYTHYLQRWTLLQNNFFSIGIFPSMFFTCPFILRIWIYTGITILAGLPLIILWPQNQPVNLGNKTHRFIGWGLRGLSGLIFISLLTTAGFLNLHCQMEDFYLIDRLGGEGRWAEATIAADQAFYQRSQALRPNRANHFLYYKPHKQIATTAQRLGIKPIPFRDDLEEGYMAELLKINLLANRQATHRLFSYNGPTYFPLLFPEDILYSPASYYMALYYTQNGLYAEALHIFYDLVTSNRISTAVLEPLMWNSVIVGDYAPCRKFIRFFEQSLFHKDIARRYTAYLADTTALVAQPKIAAARFHLSQRDHTVSAYHPDENIYFHHLYEPENPAVYEYTLALQMVYKNHEFIVTELPKIRRYYYTLPIHIQEAVLANFSIEHLDDVPIDIAPAIRIRYAEFLQTIGLYQNGYLSFHKLKTNFEGTYWYHLYFNELKAIEPKANNNSGQI